MTGVEVSLVATVKNEERSIDAFLDSLFAQSRRPDEVILVDGGSADGTVARIQAQAEHERSIRVIEAPGANIAEGRNIAIGSARGRVIAVADAGTVLDPLWLERLVQPLLADAEVRVSSGFYEPGGTDWLERAISVVITPHISEIDPSKFLPSSRSVAFLRDWWERVDGYPEWLRHCEDLVFDFALRDAGATFSFVPDARVTWRARKTLGGFFRQYFDYGRGDGHAHLWPRRHAIRYSAYLAGCALARAAPRSPVAAIILGIGIALHLRRPVRRVALATCFDSGRQRTAACALAPVIVVVGDVAKMAGYPLGLFERARGINGASARGLRHRG
jgi:glycosyltransferase involved in cell wall biosynthesis